MPWQGGIWAVAGKDYSPSMERPYGAEFLLVFWQKRDTFTSAGTILLSWGRGGN